MFSRTSSPILEERTPRTSSLTRIITLFAGAILCLGVIGAFFIQSRLIQQVAAKQEQFATAADYNQLTKAHNILVLGVSNLQHTVSDLHTQVQAGFQRQAQISQEHQEQFTNLYIKLGEHEVKLREPVTPGLDALSNRVELLTTKLDGLQRSILKLSQAVQLLQPTNPASP